MRSPTMLPVSAVMAPLLPKPQVLMHGLQDRAGLLDLPDRNAGGRSLITVLV